MSEAAVLRETAIKVFLADSRRYVNGICDLAAATKDVDPDVAAVFRIFAEAVAGMALTACSETP